MTPLASRLSTAIRTAPDADAAARQCLEIVAEWVDADNEGQAAALSHLGLSFTDMVVAGMGAGAVVARLRAAKGE